MALPALPVPVANAVILGRTARRGARVLPEVLGRGAHLSGEVTGRVSAGRLPVALRREEGAAVIEIAQAWKCLECPERWRRTVYAGAPWMTAPNDGPRCPACASKKAELMHSNTYRVRRLPWLVVFAEESLENAP